MNLYINSPSYYTQRYGIIDEIYEMCLAISKKIDITSYTDALDTIGITPIIVPDSEKSDGQWLECRKVSIPARMASLSLCLDFERFYDADINDKKIMILENILFSLSVVKKKLKERFDYKQIHTDISEIGKQFVNKKIE